MPITHLHVHSTYTLLGATASIDALARQARRDGLTHLALTDTDALYGVVEFHRACRAVGVQPILGMSAHVALPSDLREGVPQVERPGTLILLATRAEGYRSLCRLSSHLQGHPDRSDRITRGLTLDTLQDHADGLICLTGGRQGWVERCLRADRRWVAHRYAGRLCGIYGVRDTNLSIEIHTPADESIARRVQKLGDFLGIPAVAVHPIYCLKPSETPRLRLLAAIDRNSHIQDVPASALPHEGNASIDVHWLQPTEMEARYAAFPDALDRIEEIASRCEPALPEGNPVWPAIDLPDTLTPDEALSRLANEGLRDRYTSPPDDEIADRLKRELEAIANHGYSPLFLVVADVVRFAREADIPVSTRGSVANSLVAYCTGITTVDPIEHDLLFERFLSPARADAPDIDLDLCSRRRDEVLDHVRRTYGEESVALVSTVNTMRLRSAARETAKAYGLSQREMDRLRSLIPRHHHRGPGRDAERARARERIRSPRLREVFEAATHIEGLPHHLSVHPGGIVITPGPLTDVLPVQWATKGFLVTQYDHHDVEVLGLPKIDLLGIRALTVLTDAAGIVQREFDPDFRLAAIPNDDPSTGDLIARAETVGVFQCESDGARRTLRKLNARTVRDLAIANAFFKPGPSTGGMADVFVRRYRGEEPVTYLHPALAPILSSTKGVLIFQEQILRIAREVAGLSWEEADHLRRGMSKFKQEEMAQMEARFVEGCQRQPPEGPGMSLARAEELWQQVVAFSGYGFNKGHATAYADVSYRSAYLKAHWPIAFLCARLMNRGGFHHPALYLAEAVRLGLTVRPPHVNQSQYAFTLSQETGDEILWMGLGWIRDLRRSSVRAIIDARRARPFEGLRDLVSRVPLHRKEIVHLVQCGALDGLGANRAALLVEAAEIQRAGNTHQMAFTFAQPTVEPESAERRRTWERRLLGYPISTLDDPLASVVERLPPHVILRELEGMRGDPVTTAGVRLPGRSRSGQFYLWDGETWVEARLDSALPPPWTPLIVHGRWLQDEWGSGWLQIDRLRELSQT